MKKLDHGVLLRWGFGLFFLLWGIERICRADTWASPDFLGNFYGEIATNAPLVIAVGVVEILIALSFFLNLKVRLSAIVGFLVVLASTFATIKPFFTYFVLGSGSPVPNMLFIDHAPLLVGLYAIWDHSKK